MITLYHCTGARSLRPLWALEELGLPYDLKVLPFPPRVFEKPFLGINPLGTIPYLVDGEEVLTESAAACQYLADRYGPTPLALRPDEPGYGAYLNWLHHGEATLTFPQTIVLRYMRLEPPERRLPQAVTDYGNFFVGRLKLLDAALADGREYLVADRFTMADVSVAYALYLAETLGLQERFSPLATAYLARMRGRPAFQRADART